MKKLLSAFALTSCLTLTGCAPKDDFADYEFIEPQVVEGVTARTEFSEYSGDTERINVIITNDSDEGFSGGGCFLLQKLVDGEWRPIKAGGNYTLIGQGTEPHSERSYSLDLANHIKLPLLPEQYRIWVGDGDGTYENNCYVPAEFTVK